jgi:hypothetical protein
MQKILATLFILYLFVYDVQAQKSFWGVDAGINVANLREHMSLISTNTFGQNNLRPALSGFFHFVPKERLGIRLAAKYMGLGFKHSGALVDKVDIDYLTFSLTGHYYFNEHFSFNAGPYLSFTIGGTKINDQDITKTYHKNDFGFSFGTEHDLYKNFALGINYFVGTKNIYLNDNGGTIKDTNRALQLTLIYKFKKKS